ncbi:MAG: MFS transporter [Chloroflexi bacterium]|nr:MFS transporter [Chloroflexota bacterium]
MVSGLVASLRVLRHPGKIYYGWWMVLAGTTINTISSAVFSSGMQVFFLPLAREFGTSRTVLSGAFSAIRVESGLTGPIEGYLIDRFGPRRIMIFGFIVFGLGFILLSRVQTIPQFYGAFILTALGASFSGFMAVTAAVVNWFSRLRGRVLGIAMSGFSLGAVLVPIIAWSILTFGWRPTAASIGVFLWLAGLPLALVMRHRPEQYGLLPDGAQASGVPSASPTTQAISTQSDQVRRPATSVDFTARQALKTPTFWLLGLAQGASISVWGMMSVHQIPALVDKGLSEQMAATILALGMGVAVAGRLAGGILGDIFGSKQVLVVAYICQSISLVVLAVSSALWHMVIFAILFGFSFGARAPLITGLRVQLFGRKAFATITGMTEPVLAPVTVTAPILAGYIYDLRGSYLLALLIVATVNLLGIFLLLAVRTPSLPATRPATPTAMKP